MEPLLHKVKSVLLFIAAGLAALLVIHWFVPLLLILLFIVIPLGVFNAVLFKCRKLPKRIEFRMESESWFVPTDIRASAFLKALPALFPEGSILCVNSDSELVRKFLAGRAVRVELGVTWFWQKLRPVTFHLSLDMDLADGLNLLLKDRCLGGVFEVFAIYKDEEVFFYSPASCEGGFLFSKKLEEEKLKRFFAEAGCEYK